MPLEAPNLDTRTFEDLLAEARLRISRYNPGWTDFNESDPGITLVQLFAWISELMLYRFNQVPSRNYIKFLQLMGLELRAAQPAIAHLTFTATPGAVVDPVRRFTKVTAQPPGGGEPLIFETDTGVDIIRASLTDLQVFDGTAFSVVTSANQVGGGEFAPFGIAAQPGSALYLGFSPPDPPASGRIFPQEIRLRVFLSDAAQAGGSQDANAVNTPPASPVELVWDYRPSSDSKRWQSLNAYLDESLGFTREGYIVMEGPPNIAATVEGRVTAPRYWLRARLAGGSYPTGRIPQLDFVRFNTAPAINLSTVHEEDIGRSDGTPAQVFKLSRRPVVPDSLLLSVEITGVNPETWVQVEDFLASGKDDPHYTFQGNTAEVRFGDGTHGRIPSAGALIVANRYRFGGGSSGNVPPGSINGLPGNITGLASVTNERGAVSGRDEQSVDELKAQAPHELRSRNRAVTADDFAYLASHAGGVAKAAAVPLMHPDFPGVDVPGAVTVLIVPDNDSLAPMPTADHLRAVSAYLNRFRLLTTELFVKGPQYKEVRVDVLVAAKPYASFDGVARDVKAALNFYLDPLARIPKTGKPSDATLGAAGTEQWNFGESFHPTNLFSVILGVDGVAFVKSLGIKVDGARQTDLSIPVALPPDGLLSSGNHRITVVPV
jgi:predicted phage baseplate assembly protein